MSEKHYTVTDDGRVFSRTGWRGYHVRELKQIINRDGYAAVRFVIDGRRISKRVHRLVAEIYLDPPQSPNHEVRHLDGNKLNNHVSNLAWGTQKQNADDRARHGRTSCGQRHSQAIKLGLEKRRA